MSNFFRGASLKKLITFLGIGIAAFIIFILSFKIVPTGYTGVRVRLRQAYNENLSAGWHWKIPFVDEIKLVNNKQQDYKIDTQIWGETSERAELYYTQITVSYRLEAAYSSFWISSVDNYKDTLFTGGLVTSAIKNMSKQYNNVDATNRALIEPKTTELLQQAFNEKYGEGKVTIIKVTIGDINFTDSYNAAVANKQTAQLQYEAQQIENQKAIEMAQANAEVQRTTAQGAADAAIIEANAEAEANAIREKSLTPSVLEYEVIKRWDGRLPMFGSGNGFMPVIDVSKYTDGSAETTPTGPVATN